MPTRPAAPGGDHPGRRLGLPAQGPGSVAGIGARLLGLVVDWVVCLLVVALFVGGEVWTGRGWVQLAPLLVLFVEQTLLVGLLGTAIGHRVVRIRVVDPRRHNDRGLSPSIVMTSGTRGGPIGLPRGAVRALLLCLAVPPLLMDADLRGLHDRAAGSVVVRD